MTKFSVVVDDPTGNYWDGALVTDKEVRIIEPAGTCLPVDADQIMVNGLGGWTKRSWGSGYPLETTVPGLVCRMALYLTTGLWRVHCAFRLLPSPEVKRWSVDPGLMAMNVPGGVGFVGDTSQLGLLVPHVRPAKDAITSGNLGPLDKGNPQGWTIRMPATVRAERTGPHAFALYGALRGVRVEWCALSVQEPA